MNKKNNVGSGSTGHGSTGSRSTGHGSTGHWSTGDWSTGHRSTGNWSTGDWSTGHWSTGHGSTGSRSTGDWSTGRGSTGNWSISNYSTGHFSTIDYDGFGVFNKPCSIVEWDSVQKPNFLYLDLTEWVDVSAMSDEEKTNNPDHEITHGYLKVYDYKEAWAKAWGKATEKDKELLFKLPNFDAEIFKEISGIDVNESNLTI